MSCFRLNVFMHLYFFLIDKDKRRDPDHDRHRRKNRDHTDYSHRSERSYRAWEETTPDVRFKDEPLTPNIKIKDSPSRFLFKTQHVSYFNLKICLVLLHLTI